MRRLFALIIWIAPTTGGLLLWAGQVGPRDAWENWKKWWPDTQALPSFQELPTPMLWTIAGFVLSVIATGYAGYKLSAGLRIAQRAQSAARSAMQTHEHAVQVGALLDHVSEAFKQQQDEFVPLREAATQVYETLRQSAMDQAPDELSDGSVLDWCATFLSVRGVQIYGKHPPSRTRELIPEAELRRLHFEKDATELHRLFSPRNPIFKDLEVKHDELTAALKAIRTDYGEKR